MEHHGGKLWLESEVGRGSTFSFSLSLTPTESEAELEAAVAKAAGREAAVLDPSAAPNPGHSS